jgi:hypothetical protein
MTLARGGRVASIILISGFAIVPVTLATELALGWLSPHGDGFPTLLFAVLLMFALCLTSYVMLGRNLEVDNRLAARSRIARALALAGVTIPLAIFALLAFLTTRPIPH